MEIGMEHKDSLDEKSSVNKLGRVSVLGIFVADLCFTSARMPKVGETIEASGFAVGPGGKGSNQAVAAARLGARVSLISRIGADAFGEMASRTWAACGVDASATQTVEAATGAAFILVDPLTRQNSIIVHPGAGGGITTADIEAAAGVIANSRVFVTQLEQPLEAAARAMQIAREAGVITILNPAPAKPLSPEVCRLCDYLVPNEPELEALTGVVPDSIESARMAGDRLLELGVGTALITLGARGALLHGPTRSIHVGAVDAGPVVDTTGAGDAFIGGFAAALSLGCDPLASTRFGCAAAGIAVTRLGTAPAMPALREVEALLTASSPTST
ncbi:ribokinase [Phenylobacterium sp. LH3H17]|uniref:ribokinase n=1 Tax=Phenylobacterium sp. LH3H17 TaxID=2903901 RepID=UPI0020C9CD75|nr:ribokinase [Phenylobacterium sp. LH3H17]UTP38305.1 ribokinase [Phenylobacterium sp. LH3H17]